jgi:uncharacterized protein (DUF2342 family)
MRQHFEEPSGLLTVVEGWLDVVVSERMEKVKKLRSSIVSLQGRTE